MLYIDHFLCFVMECDIVVFWTVLLMSNISLGDKTVTSSWSKSADLVGMVCMVGLVNRLLNSSCEHVTWMFSTNVSHSMLNAGFHCFSWCSLFFLLQLFSFIHSFMVKISISNNQRVYIQTNVVWRLLWVPAADNPKWVMLQMFQSICFTYHDWFTWCVSTSSTSGYHL